MFSRIALSVALFASIAASGPAQVKETPAPAPPDYSKEAYVIEKFETRVFEEADGRGTRELTAEAKMLSEAGVKALAVLNFTYTSANEVVDVDYVRVRKPDGTVVKTPDYNVQDMPADVTRTAPLYSDIHEKHVAVKGLGVGDTLEYRVVFRVIKPQVPGHFWYEHSFSKDAIIKQEKLEFSFPADKYVKIISPELKPEMSNEGTRRVYRWTYSNSKIKEKDPDEIPKRIRPNPSVQVTTFASWEDVGKWYGDLQKSPLEVTPAIQAKAAELTKGLKTDDEKLRAIYSFVSLRFHYIGLDFGIGRYQPHLAEDVLENGYGDCKDKHTLLSSLLKAAGYDAWPVLIHSQRKLDSDLPSPAQFDHVITVVPSGGILIWLDTTPEVAPYGLLLRLLRRKEALAIPSNAPPKLMTTPENTPFPEKQEFSAKGKLRADGTFTGHLEQSFRGDSEVALRGFFRQIAQSQWKEATQGFSYGRGFSGDVSNVTISPPEDMETPFMLSYDYVRKNYGDWENHQITPPMPQLGIEVTKDSKEKKPTEPVLLSGPGEIVYRAQVELPPGYSGTAPSPLDLVEPYAEYHSKSVIEKDVMTASRRLVIKRSEVEPDEWERFRTFGRKIGDDEFAFIKFERGIELADGKHDGDEEKGDDEDVHDIFLKGNEALQRLEGREAEKLFRKVIAIEPEYEGAHFGLGAALGAQNKLNEALAEFRKEEDLSPQGVQSYLAGAGVASILGRKDDVLEQWRKLLKADPENRDAALNVSRLLAQDGKHSEAAEVLEGAVKISPGDSQMQLALGTTYVKMGEPAKAAAHMRAAAEEDGVLRHDPELLNSVAYTLAENKSSLDLARRYAEEAVSELDARSDDDVESADSGMRVTFELSLLWDTLGWVYFQRGDLDRSESFVRASWLLGQDAIVGEHLGEIYEKQGKTKQAAHIYELALAVQDAKRLEFSAFPGSIPGMVQPDTNSREALTNTILSRYKNITGKTPVLNEAWRLPDGTWTKTPAEELSQMRAVKLGKLQSSGSAEFLMVFAPGKVESIEYVSGEESLKSLATKLKAAHYQVEFPVGSKAKLLRRTELSCTLSAGCIAVLLPPTRAVGRR